MHIFLFSYKSKIYIFHEDFLVKTRITITIAMNDITIAQTPTMYRQSHHERYARSSSRLLSLNKLPL